MGNSIQFGIIDINDLTGVNLNLLYSHNTNVTGRLVLIRGVRVYALMSNFFFNQEIYTTITVTMWDSIQDLLL